MSPRQIAIHPSILAADLTRLGTEIADAERAGCDAHHVDVMDGHYVPNLSFGLPMVECLKKASKRPLDVHLMISNPDTMALSYVSAGASSLSFHVEASTHPHRLLNAIRKAGAKAGIGINPGTSLSALEPLLTEVDFINIMTVNPGFSGQSFIPASLERIRMVAALIDRAALSAKVAVQVDGGITDENIAAVVGAGVSIVVVGNYFYKSADRTHALTKLRS